MLSTPTPPDLDTNVDVGGRKREAPPPDDSERLDRGGEDHDMVEDLCLMDRFERERQDNRRGNRALDEIVNEATLEQFLNVVGFTCEERKSVARDLTNLGQAMSNVHVAEVFSPPRVTAAASRMGFTLVWCLKSNMVGTWTTRRA